LPTQNVYGQLSFGARQAAGALKDRLADGFDSPKCPSGHALADCFSDRWLGLHLQFTHDVESKQARQQIVLLPQRALTGK
jgi:hypothetical protein